MRAKWHFFLAILPGGGAAPQAATRPARTRNPFEIPKKMLAPFSAAFRLYN
jgi:hypothetical protein